MSLETPSALLALLGLLPIVLAFVFEYRHTLHALHHLNQSWDEPMAHRLIFLKWLFGLICFVVFYLASVLALMGWQWGETAKPYDRTGLEVVVVMDVSRSMQAQDVAPSRQDRAIEILDKVLHDMPTVRFAVVGFAGGAMRLVPMTEDHVALINGLKRLRQGLDVRPSSQPGEGLDLALASFHPGSNRNQVLLLVSDGEFMGPPTNQALNELRRRGIPILVLGTGTVEGGRIPADGAWLQDASGQEVLSRLDEVGLRQLARNSRGAYVAATTLDPADELGVWLKQYLKDSEQQGFRLVPVTHQPLFLGLALIALTAFVLLRAIRWRTLW